MLYIKENDIFNETEVAALVSEEHALMLTINGSINRIGVVL